MASNKDSREVKISKTLSYLLRHGAQEQNIQISKDGYVKISDLLQHPHLKSSNQQEIVQIVNSCPKKRFDLKTLVNQSDGSEELYIRANQGHSMQNIEVEMTELTVNDQIETIIHGTFYKPWDSIRKQGLSRMSRQHIHFVENLPQDKAPISGMRSSCQVAVYVDIKKALRDGLKFYRSANDVILCPGDESGFLKTNYFIKAIDLKKNVELPL